METAVKVLVMLAQWYRVPGPTGRPASRSAIP